MATALFTIAAFIFGMVAGLIVAKLIYGGKL